MAELKEAIKHLVPQEAENEGTENRNGGEEEALPPSGTGCRRTRPRDWFCGDGDF